ncbi:hypothetical protein Tco_0801201 [Tanacetum coccineum]|uniref:Uncharacterized protein n=1 Tax=Tanacetum coccineum TaxID=301880 RepID=A0ABQ4ZZJ4_9ASTR
MYLISRWKSHIYKFNEISTKIIKIYHSVLRADTAYSDVDMPYIVLWNTPYREWIRSIRRYVVNMPYRDKSIRHMGFFISTDYIKITRITIKNKQSRTLERKSEQKPEAKPGKVKSTVNHGQQKSTRPKIFQLSSSSFRKDQKMIRKGFMFEERPNEDINVPIEDEKSPSSESQGSPRDS